MGTIDNPNPDAYGLDTTQDELHDEYFLGPVTDEPTTPVEVAGIVQTRALAPRSLIMQTIQVMPGVPTQIVNERAETARVLLMGNGSTPAWLTAIEGGTRTAATRATVTLPYGQPMVLHTASALWIETDDTEVENPLPLSVIVEAYTA